MDPFERRLRDDAARIPADISPELDARIEATLRAAVPAKPARLSRKGAHWSLWWASSLTGLAAALVLIAVLNLWPTTASPPNGPPTVVGPATVATMTPLLRAEAVVLTAPLEQELDDLEADLRKAREVVREDLGL